MTDLSSSGAAGYCPQVRRAFVALFVHVRSWFTSSNEGRQVSLTTSTSLRALRRRSLFSSSCGGGWTSSCGFTPTAIPERLSWSMVQAARAVWTVALSFAANVARLKRSSALARRQDSFSPSILFRPLSSKHIIGVMVVDPEATASEESPVARDVVGIGSVSDAAIPAPKRARLLSGEPTARPSSTDLALVQPTGSSFIECHPVVTRFRCPVLLAKRQDMAR